MGRAEEDGFSLQPLAVLVGPQISRVNVKVHNQISAIRVDFLPGGMFRMLGIPMNELSDGGFDALDFFGAETKTINEQLQHCVNLEDFEKLYATLGMGPKNYGWYQCKFHAAAKEIYNLAGKKGLKSLWKTLKNHQEEVSDEEFARILNAEVHPVVGNVYLEWNKNK